MLSIRLPTVNIARCLIPAMVRHQSSKAAQNATKSIVHQVYPYSNIKINSNYHLNIKPCDPIDYPEGNLVLISLQAKQAADVLSEPVKKFMEKFDAKVQIDDQNVLIDTVDDLGTQVKADELANSVVCVIEVPVKANIKVTSKRDVSIQGLSNDDINVIAKDGDLTTKNIQSTNLSLITRNGNINCEGTTLAQKADIRSHGDKNIHLNHVLGDSLTAISENGAISTNSCYAENSKFITQKGALHLKNVHKKSELYLVDGGELDVTGFHGVLNATTNGGTLNFQLTEIFGESCIEAQSPIKFQMNISEFVEQHTCLSIAASQIEVDPSLANFEKSSTDDGEALETGNRDLCDDSLTIRTNGSMQLRKLSWMDSVKLKISQKKQAPK